MMRKNITARLIGLLAWAALLVSCSSPTTAVPQPTADQNMLNTAAAQTAVVKRTLIAALNAANTPQPPSDSSQPGSEAQVEATYTATPTAAATATPQEPTATATNAATATVNPALYPTRTPRRVPDVAALVSSSPPDGAVFNSGNSFDAVWTLKNTGPTTWTTDYHIRFARGADMSEAPRYYLKGAVQPGESVDLVADMIAPDEKGVQVGYWEFVNGNGDVIFTMYVAITVE